MNEPAAQGEADGQRHQGGDRIHREGALLHHPNRCESDGRGSLEDDPPTEGCHRGGGPEHLAGVAARSVMLFRPSMRIDLEKAEQSRLDPDDAGLAGEAFEQRRKKSRAGRLVLRLTWLLASLAAYFLFDMEPAMVALLGAILVVTGPTVIIPLLRHVRPTDRINKTLKWEGILIDPVGAVLAVLVFESVVAGSVESAPPNLPMGVRAAATR